MRGECILIHCTDSEGKKGAVGQFSLLINKYYKKIIQCSTCMNIIQSVCMNTVIYTSINIRVGIIYDDDDDYQHC